MSRERSCREREKTHLQTSEGEEKDGLVPPPRAKAAHWVRGKSLSLIGLHLNSSAMSLPRRVPKETSQPHGASSQHCLGASTAP